MKTHIISILFCLLPCIAAAQEGWYLGVQANPFHYWMYNKHDFSSPITNLPVGTTGMISDHLVPKSQRFFSPQGLGFGFSLGYRFYHNWGLGGGIQYSRQNQQFEYSNVKYDFNHHSLTDKFEYLHLPVFVDGSILFDKNLRLYGKFGLKYSYLISSEYTYSSKDSSNSGAFNIDSWQSIRNNADYYILYNINNSINEQKATLSNNIFNNHLIGFISEIGIMLRIGNQWALKASFTSSFDFTNTENLNSYEKDDYDYYRYSYILLEDHEIIQNDLSWEPIFSTSRAGVRWRSIPKLEDGQVVGWLPRAKTHNIRAGISVELRYYFNP